MAVNIIDEGRRIPFVCTGNVASGSIVVSNNLFGVALSAGVSGDTIMLSTGVRCSLPKANAVSTAFVVGGNVYWDATNSQATVSATSNTRIGVATAAASNTATTVTTRLNGSF